MEALLPAYAELHCVSNFSFQRGASHPGELVRRAHELGYVALAITDECSLAGVVRAYQAWLELREEAKLQGRAGPALKLIVGSEFRVEADTPFRLVVLARNREGYGNLSEFITRLRRSSAKGSYRLAWPQVVPASLHDCFVLLVPDRSASFDAVYAQAQWLRRAFGDRGRLAVELLRELDDHAWLHRLREVARLTGVPLVAAGDVHMHVRSRKPLQDVLTAIRLGRPVRDCGTALQPSAERHLRSRLRLAQVYPPELLQASVELAAQCTFSLGELAYEYPEEVVPPGETAASYLRRMTYEGARERFPQGLPPKVHELIERELALIGELKYEKYFLTVYDIVRFARSQGILCQGRGSAANSAVCYCLGITEIDPARIETLFERFISKERNEPPDIDVDFEHQRREEVIQHLYRKYGRDRTALAATVITYRSRSAIRDVGKALGFDEVHIDALARSYHGWDHLDVMGERLAELGLDLDEPRVQQWIALTLQLRGFPRHLSQHTGGFVIAKGPLSRIVPIENAAMPDRTVIEWDKDDLDTLRLMKVDVLALGMLSAIRRTLDFISQRRGRRFRLQDIPDDDGPTFEMIGRADTIGVFQVESRAQQSMLPRLKPRNFYDLVVQVAIVRPGPIQGGMVHPYLKQRELAAERRRQGLPPLEIEDPRLRQALGRTLGVPIFQEQVMQLCILCADFTPGDADRLRRAMAAWKRHGDVTPFRQRIVEGMTRNGYAAEFAEALFRQIEGFGEYGFPESHAASFALLAYASSWMKCHEPAAFLAGLLNAQPMGFYSPSQLVQDARRHGVEVRPVDVQYSAVEAALEDLDATPPGRQPPVRLGLQMIQGLGRPAAERIVQARRDGPFADVQDLARRAALDASDLRRLAGADALRSLAGHRRQQVWQAAAWQPAPPLLGEAPVAEPQLELLPAPEGEEVLFDYSALKLTLRSHPLQLLRPLLARRRLMTSAALHALPDGRLARACGIVTMRQQPGTAQGTIFVSLEDETGAVNVIVWPRVRDRQRRVLLESRLLAVYGRWQRQDGVCHLVADRLENLTPLLGRLGTRSRDFR
ncbi:error-prone DNA polymerase [Caldimonas thermodepolymerans]|uniref:Error-prone DNA polymerase n=1 Tax=Caldimonas thermodepolymerans TaxID=215580 RepID=A0AA46DGC8_9BURK|nr:error-prone DNA polymerase [Caldimonas thermodepolymerans]TCP08989.1 error-prone DNA polymerase [Caldimonas thermodepolymerans]UZG43625.1 error-prone DNA polymerase [Caldimonas thermodepolymerans]UZG49985.1 error-prone DNA polymerase [Caldimonas thermodepolymerans]